MNYYPFNSRNKLYKNIVGAVASDKELTLRLLLHKDALTDTAFLCIRKDGEELTEYEMKPCEMLEDYRFYECSLKLSEGIYWYYFRYTSFYGEFFVSKEQRGNGVVSREKGRDFQQTVYSPAFKTPDWLKGGIIYQIFPDRFYCSGEKKKNVPTDRVLRSDWGEQPYFKQDDRLNMLGNDYFCGDLKGIEQKLSYLKQLGVTAIYLNPIFEAHSNHRYNTANYLKIDPLLGDENDFASLCRAAHQNGIRIILDGVFSHTGDDSVYFNKYKRYETEGAYGNKSSPYRNWYKFGETDDDYISWWGVRSLPETDEENADYLDFICGENGVLEHWLRLGADGWRIDVADELPDGFIEALRSRVKKTNPDAFILGEVWEDASNKISYGKRRKYLYGDELDSVMNYPFANGIKDYLRTANAERLCETVSEICENYPAPALHTLMNHIGTHDTARIINVLSRNDDNYGDRNAQSGYILTPTERKTAHLRLKAAAVLQYTLVGVPSVFYGDEAGIEGFADPFCRKCYPWGQENTALIGFYTELGRIRLSLKVLKSGDFEPYEVRNGLFSFLRKDENGSVLVAVNAGDNAESLTLPENYKTVFGSPAESGTVTLGKYEYFIAKEKGEE